MTQLNTAALDTLLHRGQAEANYWQILTDPTRTGDKDKSELVRAMTVLGYNANDVAADLAALADYRDLPARERAEEAEAKAAEAELGKARGASLQANEDLENWTRAGRLAAQAEIDRKGKEIREKAELLKSHFNSANGHAHFYRQNRGQLRKAAVDDNPRIQRFLAATKPK